LLDEARRKYIFSRTKFIDQNMEDRFIGTASQINSFSLGFWVLK